MANSFYQPGETIQFAGNATDFADAPLSAGSLTWTVEFCDTNSTNIVAGPISGVSAGNYSIPSDGEEATNGFHRIILVATDTFGRAATNCVDIFPNPTNTDWTAYYPFDNGAADANGFFNGSLQNGATTPSDSDSRAGFEFKRREPIRQSADGHWCDENILRLGELEWRQRQAAHF